MPRPQVKRNQPRRIAPLDICCKKPMNSEELLRALLKNIRESAAAAERLMDEIGAGVPREKNRVIQEVKTLHLDGGAT